MDVSRTAREEIFRSGEKHLSATEASDMPINVEKRSNREIAMPTKKRRFQPAEKLKH